MPDDLTGDEILLLVEALDAFMPPRGTESPAWGQSPPWTAEQKARYEPFATLRYRLAHAAGMGFYDKGRTFLDTALEHERVALTEALHSRLVKLLTHDGLTRRQLREGMIAAFRELRDVRYYEVKMPLAELSSEKSPPD